MPVDSLDCQVREFQLRDACGDLARRLRLGERRVAEQILAEKPDLAARTDVALELVYTEFVTLEELGQPLDPDELYARFPQYRDQLERLLRIHQAFGDDGLSQSVQTSHGAGSTHDGFPIGSATGSALVGARIGNYQLLEAIGSGGMAVVYKARHVGLNRLVALKLIRSDHAHQERQDRFRSEAEAAARLQHPNIVQIFEIGQHEGYDYLSLEYVAGGSLAQHIARAKPTFRNSGQMILTLAQAIHHAHERGIIHRDLKPANVLLTTEGELKIADFGLAKHVYENSLRQTATGTVVGTPAYMSPEQAAGRTAHIGPGSDVYSLGAILYELLTGRPPIQGRSNWDTLEQIVRLEPTAPRRLCREVPRDLDTICIRCLEKEPHNRYVSAAQLAADLARFLDGQPIVARPVGWTERLWKWSRRRPAVAALIGVSCLTLLMLTALLIGYHYHTKLDRAYQAEERQRKKTESTLVLVKAAQQQAEIARHAAERANAAETAAREKLEEVLYFRRISLANEAWQRNRIGQALSLLDECPPERRQWEWYYVNHLCHPDCVTLCDHRDHIASIDFTPDGRYLACSGYHSTARIWDLDSRTVVRTIDGHSQFIGGVAFSPDGQRIAVSNSDGVVMICDAATGDEQLRIRVGGKYGGSVNFSADGRRLAIAPGEGAPAKIWDAQSGESLVTIPETTFGLQFSPDGRRVVGRGGNGVKIWDAQTGQKMLVVKDAIGGILSPDGERLAVVSGERSIKICDSHSGRELSVLRGHTRGVSLDFSPDGRQLASGGYDSTVKLWDLESEQEVATFKGHTHGVYALKFSPDGKHIASASMDTTIKIWSTTSTSESRRFRHETHVRSIALSPDLGRVATTSAETTAKVWDIASGKELHVLRGHTASLGTVIFSPDGQRLATQSQDKTVRIWDAVTGAELFELPCDYDLNQSLAFSPDGERLASVGRSSPLRVWDARTGKLLNVVQAHAVETYHVRFSPDGQYLVTTGGDSLVKFWNAATCQELRTLRGHTYGVWCTAFSPDGHHLATAGGDGKLNELNAGVAVKIWELQTGAELRTLKGDTDPIVSLCFSPDGRRLAAGGSGDQVIKLWDLETGQEAITLRAPGSSVYSLAFSPDGRRLYSGSASNYTCYFDVWDAGPEFPCRNSPRQPNETVRRGTARLAEGN